MLESATADKYLRVRCFSLVVMSPTEACALWRADKCLVLKICFVFLIKSVVIH